MREEGGEGGKEGGETVGGEGKRPMILGKLGEKKRGGR